MKQEQNFISKSLRHHLQELQGCKLCERVSEVT